jgi:hypothetical protein
MKKAEIVERAIDAARLSSVLQTDYVLGKGGFDPGRHVPWNRSRECDCTGFLAWCIREPRENDGIPGGWIESTMVFNDATKTQRMFRTLTGVERAEPGDIYVIGDTPGREGHVAIITEVARDGSVVKIVDCSSSNARAAEAIQRRPPGYFKANGGIVVRVKKAVA